MIDHLKEADACVAQIKHLYSRWLSSKERQRVVTITSERRPRNISPRVGAAIMDFFNRAAAEDRHAS